MHSECLCAAVWYRGGLNVCHPVESNLELEIIALIECGSIEELAFICEQHHSAR